MSSTASAVSAAIQVVPLIEQSLITLVTAEIIEQASGPAAQLAKAQAIVAITTDLIAINSGNGSGIAGLQTAFLSLVTTIKDEAIQLTFNGLFAALLTKLQGYEASGSLLGKVGGVIANDFLGYVQAAAQSYVTHLTPAA